MGGKEVSRYEFNGHEVPGGVCAALIDDTEVNA